MQDLHSNDPLYTSCFLQQEADPCADLISLDALDGLLNDMGSLELQSTSLQTTLAGHSTEQQHRAPGASTTPSPRGRRNHLHPSRPGVPRRSASHGNRRLANREAQRRWRERQTAQKDRLEARLTAAEQQLWELHGEVTQLEARNALLKFAHLHPVDVRQPLYMLGDINWSDVMTYGLSQPLEITVVGDESQSVTQQDVSNMAFPEFGMLSSLYAKKLGKYLLNVNGEAIAHHSVQGCLPSTSDKHVSCPAHNLRAVNDRVPVSAVMNSSPANSVKSSLSCDSASRSSFARDELRRLTQECLSLRTTMIVVAPAKFLAYQRLRLDGRPEITSIEQHGKWYVQLLKSMQFTEAQQEDLMLLRSLYYRRQGVLDRQSRNCFTEISNRTAATGDVAIEELLDVGSHTDKLQRIAEAQFYTALQFTSAYMRGDLPTLISPFKHSVTLLAAAFTHIYTLMQQAMSISQPYPYIADDLALFEILASQRHEASASNLLQSTRLDDLEDTVKWQGVAKYLSTIPASMTDFHVPLLRSSDICASSDV